MVKVMKKKKIILFRIYPFKDIHCMSFCCFSSGTVCICTKYGSDLLSEYGSDLLSEYGSDPLFEYDSDLLSEYGSDLLSFGHLGDPDVHQAVLGHLADYIFFFS